MNRSASALIEAELFGAGHAITLVHFFSASLEHFDDYSNIAALYDIDVPLNTIYCAANINGIDFYLGWVVDFQSDQIYGSTFIGIRINGAWATGTCFVHSGRMLR
jgi:hypothetical protein